ncbi:hypothetical protein NDU88_002864 [Pleurodeles waltl]|uniref:Uncharacterized protein n=1 Tax=Pleurodeles waltl TaxID=8319 RepID=A0AAV7NGI7_PLEWA|nr:hypothetical protein NDU88_002864 [Pleurodeles waltl]
MEKQLTARKTKAKDERQAYTAATARHDASEQADASCPRLPVVGATRSDRGRGQAVARETGWISRRGEFKREDGTDRGGKRRRAETKEQNAEEERQEEDVENRSPEETQEEQEQERRDQEEQEQERRDQEEQEQERRAQEKERRAQEKEQEQERRAQEKERRAQEKERRAQEKERRDQEKETPQETEGEETPSEERYNASHDPGGSWLTKEQERRDQEEQEQERIDQEEQEQERRAQEKERRAQEKEQEQERRAQEKERRAQEKERRAQEKERRDQEKETPQETEGEETPSEERYNASHDPGGSWLTKIPPEGTARRLPGKEPLQLYQLDRHYRNCTATPKENPDT